MKVKHGHYQENRGTPTYHSWQAMKQRCNNPSNPSYKRYGGRGITYVKRWEEFENFLSDMGERPEGTTIGRKDNNKGYSKNNCRWESSREQHRNKTQRKSNTGHKYISRERCRDVKNGYVYRVSIPGVIKTKFTKLEKAIEARNNAIKETTYE